MSRNIAPLRGGAPCYQVAELDFDDMASLQAAFQSPAGQETGADVATLARLAPVRSMVYELEDLQRPGPA